MVSMIEDPYGGDANTQALATWFLLLYGSAKQVWCVFYSHARLLAGEQAGSPTMTHMLGT